MPDIKQNTSYSDSLGEGIGGAIGSLGKIKPANAMTAPAPTAPSPAPTAPSPTPSTSPSPTPSQSFYDTQFSGVTEAKNYLGKLGPVTTKPGDVGGFEKWHPGIDIGLKGETDLIGFDDGVVESVRTGHKTGEKNSYGNQMILRKPNGDRVLLNHLGQVYVKPGDTVAKGQKWGTMSNTGSVISLGGGGYHLDLRIKDLHDRWLNPDIYYGLTN